LFKNKRILVTGADGFIGSHLVEALVEQDAQVRALAFYNSFNHWGWLEEISKQHPIEVVTGDIRDVNTCHRIMKGIDIVFHLAALISIPYSYLAPESYIATNVVGTTHLCQAAFDNRVERFVHISTSEVYGSAKYIPMDENHPLQPQSPYSASKIGAESIAMSYFFTFGLPVTVIRLFNTYGPRQTPRAIIPCLITQLMEGKTQLSVGNVSPKRDFTFVLDACHAFLLLAHSNGAVGEIINIGTGTQISIENLAEKIGLFMGRKIELVQEQIRIRPQMSEVDQLCCNPQKLKEITSFLPEVSLEEGLEKTIEWFSSRQSEYKVGIYHV
jgi:NAD dependent epimerase/dehydratase